MKAPRASTVLAGATLAFALCWLYFILYFIWESLLSGRVDTVPLFVSILLILPLALPGLVALCCGVCLLRDRTATDIKACLACLMAPLVLLFPILVGWLPLNDEAVSAWLAYILGMLVALSLYLRLTAFFLRKEGLPVPGWRSRIGRGWFFVLALLLWLLAGECFRLYLPATEDVTSGWYGVRLSVEVFAPILLAWGFYKFAVSRWVVDDPVRGIRREVSNPRFEV